MFEIGDRVKINNVNSYSYGLVGTVIEIQDEMVTVRFGGRQSDCYIADFCCNSLKRIKRKLPMNNIEVYDNV